MRTGDVSRIAAIAVLVGFAGASGAATVTTVPLGKANGVVGIYYNNNGNGEIPTNQAYIRAQFSDTNTNGLVFNFDTTPLPGTGGAISWASLFQVVPNQFGLDLVLKSASADGSVTIPLNAATTGTTPCRAVRPERHLGDQRLHQIHRRALRSRQRYHQQPVPRGHRSQRRQRRGHPDGQQPDRDGDPVHGRRRGRVAQRRPHPLVHDRDAGQPDGVLPAHGPPLLLRQPHL